MICKNNSKSFSLKKTTASLFNLCSYVHKCTSIDFFYYRLLRAYLNFRRITLTILLIKVKKDTKGNKLFVGNICLLVGLIGLYVIIGIFYGYS